MIILAAVVVEFDYTSYTATESQGTAVMFQIVKRAIITQPVSVIFNTLPGTATGDLAVNIIYRPNVMLQLRLKLIIPQILLISLDKQIFQ